MLRLAETDLTDSLIDRDYKPSDFPPIDVNALIRQKSPALASQLQGWRLAVLRWLVCEKHLNHELMNMPPMPPRAFPGWALDQLGVAMTFPAARTLPDETERPVFLANHPTGGLDGLTLLHGLLQHYRSVQVVVTDLLLTIPPLQSLVVAVDRYQSSRTSVHTLNQAFAGDSALLVFPAGRTARRQRSTLTEFPWHSMPVSLATRYGRPLVPLHTDPIAQEILALTPLARFRGLMVYAFYGDDCPRTLQAIGRLREQGFKAAGAGRGLEEDLDHRDSGPDAYQQLVVWDPDNAELVALYRFQLGSLAALNGLDILRTYSLFDYSDRFVNTVLPFAIELGRSVVNPGARKRTLGFFATWVGLGALLRAYPTVSYFFGNVSLYDTLPTAGRDRLVTYMHTVYAPPQPLLVARPDIRYTGDDSLADSHAETTGDDTPESRINQLRDLLSPWDMTIPPVLQSYMSLSTGIWCGETAWDADFGDALEMGLIVPVSTINAKIRARFIDISPS